jgi:3-deoxy-D-manno-octulosonate 8-phosphate phosphatase (KDO 8-P phosphatase)
MKLPKLVLTDIDGVWTDGGMYYDQTGNEWKRFNTSDSAGVIFLKLMEIPLGIITGEDTLIVERRAKKLKIDYLFQGASSKIKIVKKLCEKLSIEMADIAYIGDDINDIEVLNSVGFSSCPKNAPEYIKKKVSYVTKKAGGEGAFREFIEYILEQNNKLDHCIDLYLASKQS